MYVETGIIPPTLRVQYITDKFILKTSNYNLPHKEKSLQVYSKLYRNYPRWQLKTHPRLVDRIVINDQTRKNISCIDQKALLLQYKLLRKEVSVLMPLSHKGILGAREIFSEFVKSNTNGIFVYTDGSKTKDHTTAAVVSQKLDVKRTYILNNFRTILSAELKAIQEAINFILQNDLSKTYFICTDSLSSVKLIQNTGTFTDDRDLISVRATLVKHDNIHLVWVPGHENIEGNCLADKQARNILNAQDMSDEKIHYSNFIPLTARNVLDDWQLTWNQSTQLKGKYLHRIQDKISRTAWFETIHLPKRITNIISRARLGHGTFPSHLHRINLKEDNLCDCGEQGTLDHIFLHCENLRSSSDLHETLNALKIPLTSNLNHILKEENKTVYLTLKKHLIQNNIEI